MAGDGDKLPEIEDENVKFGFKRSEMNQSPLAGTVDPYDRHVFLAYKSYEVWPPRIEASDSDPLPKLFAAALKSRKNDITPKARLTICDSGESLKLADGDVLIFPDNVVYRGLKESDVESFVDEVLVHGSGWTGGKPEVLTGAYVFVCCHNTRDRRCGVCGPALIEKFKEIADAKDLKQPIQVTACSHIGGHKYAGNAIIFSSNAEQKTAGNWYGYVTPDDVDELIEKQIIQGNVVERLWRGQMGAPAPVVEDGKVSDPNPTTEANGIEKQADSNGTEQQAGGCCQGAGGFSCCRSENLKSFKAKFEGFGKWEQRHVLTAVAVVGAVAAALVVAHKTFSKNRS